MPTEAENVRYLYLVLTSEGTPTIDWDAVGTALDLKKGAVTKRWSRLKQTMDKGDNPTGTTYPFLWLCVKHSKRDKLSLLSCHWLFSALMLAMNWETIAKKCNTTSGAASKRYSRMKQAFDEGVAPPGAGAKSTPSNGKATPKSTPKKTKTVNPEDGTEDANENNDENQEGDEDAPPATTTPKRKRPTPKKKPVPASEQKFKPEPEDDEADEEEETRKRIKTPKRKIVPKPKTKATPVVKANIDGTTQESRTTPTTEATTVVKTEIDEDDEEDDAFHDAQEQPEGEADLEDQYIDYDAPLVSVSTSLTTNGDVDIDGNGDDDTIEREECTQCLHDVIELANALLSRRVWLAEDERVEVQGMLEGVDAVF